MNTVGCAAAVGRQSGAKIHPQGKWFYPLSERWHLVRHPTSLLEVGPSCPDACHITRRKEGAREGGREALTMFVALGRASVRRRDLCPMSAGLPPPQLRLTMFLPSPRSLALSLLLLDEEGRKEGPCRRPARAPALRPPSQSIFLFPSTHTSRTYATAAE